MKETKLKLPKGRNSFVFVMVMLLLISAEYSTARRGPTLPAWQKSRYRRSWDLGIFPPGVWARVSQSCLHSDYPASYLITSFNILCLITWTRHIISQISENVVKDRLKDEDKKEKICFRNWNEWLRMISDMNPENRIQPFFCFTQTLSCVKMKPKIIGNIKVSR